MKKLFSKNYYIKMSFVISFLFWVIESLIHYLVFDNHHSFTMIPDSGNELWMRSLICGFIVISGFIIQKQVEKLLSSEEDKRRTVKATLFTIQDIIGNSMNRLILLHLEAKDSGSINKETLGEVEDIIYSTTDKLTKIANLKVLKTKELSNNVYGIDIKFEEEEN